MQKQLSTELSRRESRAPAAQQMPGTKAAATGAKTTPNKANKKQTTLLIGMWQKFRKLQLCGQGCLLLWRSQTRTTCLAPPMNVSDPKKVNMTMNLTISLQLWSSHVGSTGAERGNCVHYHWRSSNNSTKNQLWRHSLWSALFLNTGVTIKGRSGTKNKGSWEPE